MNAMIAVSGLVALAWVSFRLVLLVLRDGHGVNPPPRSHLDELGDRGARQLR